MMITKTLFQTLTQLFLAAAAAVLTITPVHAGQVGTCKQMFGKRSSEKTTLIFVADNGTYSGTDEGIFVKANLKNIKNWTSFDFSCTGGAQSGLLMGQKVMIITTGIGPMQAAVCVQYVMLQCPNQYKEAFFMGTAGFPSTFGGILNPQKSCTETNIYRNSSQIVRLGDLCISVFAANWDCRLADWSQQAKGYPNVCSAPEETFGPTADFLYGKCLFTSPPKKSMALAAELATAARSASMKASMPPRIKALAPYETQYWKYVEEGTGVTYDVYPENDTTTNVWDHTQCVEVDSQFFFSGAPWEYETRNFTAITLNQGFNTDTYQSDAVMYSNAMEAIGFSQVMEAFTLKAGPKKAIPYTVMRSASDYSVQPLRYLGGGNWTYYDLPSDNVDGYAQAIVSYSNAFLTLFKTRCEFMSMSGSICKFKVDTAILP
ncbi:hypothetical protein CEUSTIGMA_g1890.t1 [Chlamydomonas eustigma]|uniref:Nucleoside phosphorylase domain-containing protein n=1 Tax=Chlamydomonas eustigma TaxID=1157962 RepID=A0A250WUG2_9CHLO|nr:hypothetical protein CEUSTIGMA_g1890.t1 [Chlamydomonas eustigma]|eukprot:GAX74441.1 hypothetical protein CEUSTIGMA_g1890.t1 [Chlamydomonas eustigma]